MGLHALGFIISLLVLLPNLIFLFFPPRSVPDSLNSAPLVFTLLERAGQITCFMLPILFGRLISAQTLGVSAVLMALCLLVYYGGWVRYFRSGRAFTALFKPWLGIPVPMAVFPALYFLLLGVWLQSWLFIVSACLFAAGHLVNSWSVYGQLR
ncbi:hypothetical protein MKZ07_15835 [Paenibacillus sp. FSL P4-0338]|uniref:hypothetical protein n=1 Tax=unclassified Paenibacillus TaxID=185978 RepID=UPI0003E1F410|nr:hypothetical protein [Paenibacillus sp. FSL R7-269]ETT56371.1 hypothetical protein C162_01689 [Paenibacillus sp. FSL R7-269]